MVLIEESEKYKGLVMELKKFYSANGLSLETTAAILDTCAVVLSRLANELRDDEPALDRVAEQRDEAVHPQHICPSCAGTGTFGNDDESPIVCEQCRGAGHI